MTTMYICDACGKYVEKERIVSTVQKDDDVFYVCDACITDTTIYCDHCGCTAAKADAIQEQRGKFVCGRCIERGSFARCENCGDLVERYYTTKTIEKNNVCQYCIEAYYIQTFIRKGE